MERADRGNSTVEFVLVTGLLLFLFMGVLQFGFALHTRNVLVAAAQEGARFGANADRGPAEAEVRTREVVSESLSPAVAGRLTGLRASVDVDSGVRVMRVELTAPLPVLFLPISPMDITVTGHALEEG